MTPFERLSAVRSAAPHTDMLLLSLLDLEISTSSVPPTTAKDRPVDGDGLVLPEGVFASVVTNRGLAAALLMKNGLWRHRRHWQHGRSAQPGPTAWRQ